MKLRGLIDLGLILILASKGVKSQSWNVSVPERINATLGSNVTINCTFTYPQKYESVQVYWKKLGEQIQINDKDKNPFIYHTNESLVLKKYRKQTRLIGDKSKGNCSIMILNITENESDLYVRLIVKNEQYSFKENKVSISVLGANNTSNIDPVDTSTPIHVEIFVSVSALLIIIVVVGIYCFMKHRKSQSFTREESGYYANFSRALSNQAKSEATCIKNENTQIPELKDINEPVYVNTKVVTCQMDQRMDHTENIYVNIDYSK